MAALAIAGDQSRIGVPASCRSRPAATGLL